MIRHITEDIEISSDDEDDSEEDSREDSKQFALIV